MRVIKKTLTFAGGFFLLGTLTAFFGFHTIAGERGILARPELERNIGLAEEELELLVSKKSFLEQRIALLSQDEVDADMLSETARGEVGLYAPNDVIISIDLPELKY